MVKDILYQWSFYERNIIGGAFTLASLMLAGHALQKMVLFTSSVKLSTLLVKLLRYSRSNCPTG